MKKPTGKFGCAVYAVLFLLAASVIYGLFIAQFQPSEKKNEALLRHIQATDAPAAQPVSTQTPYTATDTPAPTVTKAPTATPVPTKAPTDTPAPTQPPTLRQGDKGEAVRQIQTELIRLGYLDGSADGDFGRKTAQAVKDFQICNNLKEDGVFGSDCWNKLTSGYYVQEQRIVYVSKQNVYHTKPDCSGMKNSTNMNLSDAIRKGYKGHNCK